MPEVTEDMSGHYVMDLADAVFEEKLVEFDELGLEEKIRLLIDRNLVAKTELASSASLVPLVFKFQNENSAAVWGIVASIVSGLKIFIEPESEDEVRFKKLVGELVAPKLAEVGLVTREGDDDNIIKLRGILMGLDYYAETEGDLNKLADMYDEDYSKIEPEVRESVLDAKLYLEPEMIDEYLKRYAETADPETFSALIAPLPVIEQL